MFHATLVIAATLDEVSLDIMYSSMASNGEENRVCSRGTDGGSTRCLANRHHTHMEQT